MSDNRHQAGFVSLIGMPNSGKSTLVNAMMGLKMSIVSPKPQTTRQRIFSIWNDEKFQIVFSDLPGWIDEEKYTMHHMMNRLIRDTEEDTDLLMVIYDPSQKSAFSGRLIDIINQSNLPKLIVLNKADKLKPEAIIKHRQDLELLFDKSEIFVVSALVGTGVEELKSAIIGRIPAHEAFYPKDYLSDKPVRFFIAELIREQVLLCYEEEIPYSVFVEVEQCTGVDDEAELARIEATMYVNRKSQIPIMLGKNGAKIKELGTKSRIEIEKYLGQRVYLGLSVKLKENWRDDQKIIEGKGILR
ncbi:MAG: GTPase Era [Saprospiraceae bacterium]|nr:GTPase Era [Saprospiraceae bacterium]HMZ38701.1 GTPase Era [Saprospiraceae bacterium]HNB30382.1 GTPase Era [Saprospiraceae bacterium]HNC35324.1 GTPase Era [Saprospiraceae bacterium]HNE62477.1 GTPase Era [Saprospiraceae bacterium]